MKKTKVKKKKPEKEVKLPRYLNLGCGNRPFDQKQGWINLDIDAGCNPDIVRNFDKGLPFDSNSVDFVRAADLIEHVDDIFYLMYEIWRVSKPGTKVEIIAPNFANPMSIYPNHKRFIRTGYFEMWSPRYNINKATMNYSQETLGANFIVLSEQVITENKLIRFILQVIKNGEDQ